MQHLRATIAFLLLLSIHSLQGQLKHALRDAQGRHVIPRGYVVTTNDALGPIDFSADDYLRMVRMGADFQVVRLELGRLSTFPGCQLEEAYLQKLDSLVQLGRDVGIKTFFKMTVYGVHGFSWEDFWANKSKERDTYLEAWKAVWTRYKDNGNVIGYDLVNEPRKLTMDISYDQLTSDYLIPYYQRLIDEGNRIASGKLYLCQTIFMNKGEAIDNNQYAEIKRAIDRENVVFAPHIYQDKIEFIEPTMQRFEREAMLLDAPILVGEWGFPTYESTDHSVSEQLRYTELYIRTVEVFDRMGVGAIKAWFSGNRTMQDFLPGGRSTWAIFSDKEPVGTVERKYITDIIARPYPQIIAGDIYSFMFNHATRTLEVHLKTDNKKGASRVFIGANRHYPDGFTVYCSDHLVLGMNPLSAEGLEVITAEGDANPDDFLWDPSRQQLVILQWPCDHKEITLKVAPGLATAASSE